MTQFTGFTADDFSVFQIPEFYERMSAIRTRVRPKLAMIGEELAPRLGPLAGHEMFPHTASHARRRVNPPDDTWVAFSRSPRGYKRYAHFEVGIARDYVFVRFVVKPEGEDDKPGLLEYLSQMGPRALQLDHAATFQWYRDDHGRDPVGVTDIDAPSMDRIIQQTRLKSRGFTVGTVFSRDVPVVYGPELIEESYQAILRLSPLYLGTLNAPMNVTARP